MTHPNEVPTYKLTPAEYEQMCARTTERQQRKADAEQRAEVWPLQVDRAINLLARELASLRARVDAVEAAADRG